MLAMVFSRGGPERTHHVPSRSSSPELPTSCRWHRLHHRLTGSSNPGVRLYLNRIFVHERRADCSMEAFELATCRNLVLRRVRTHVARHSGRCHVGHVLDCAAQRLVLCHDVRRDDLKICSRQRILYFAFPVPFGDGVLAVVIEYLWEEDDVRFGEIVCSRCLP